MSLIYLVKNHYGGKNLLTAKQLYKWIMQNSKSDYYNWIALARELVRICKKPSFPTFFSWDIFSFLYLRHYHISFISK